MASMALNMDVFHSLVHAKEAEEEATNAKAQLKARDPRTALQAQRLAPRIQVRCVCMNQGNRGV